MIHFSEHSFTACIQYGGTKPPLAETALKRVEVSVTMRTSSSNPSWPSARRGANCVSMKRKPIPEPNESDLGSKLPVGLPVE